MKKILTPLFAVSILILTALAPAIGQTHNLIVISNAKGAPTELSNKELVSVMRGEKQRWNDGTRISVALMKSSTSAGEETSQKIYGMTGDEVNKFWLALVFQGKAKAPVFFNSANELETFILQTPGAIGIVEGSPDIKSKTTIVDGKKTL